MDLKGKQIKDTFGNLVTIGTTEGKPLAGFLQNGDGTDLVDVRVNGDLWGNTFNTNNSGFSVNTAGEVTASKVQATDLLGNGGYITDTDANELKYGLISDARVGGLYRYITQPMIKISWNTNYFNLNDFQDNLIPFDAQDENTSTSTFEFVNGGTSDARVFVKEAGLYEVYSRMHFFDLYGNVDILVRLMTSATSSGAMSNKTLLNDKKFAELTGDQLMLGYAIVDLPANTYVNVAMHPTANQPYPSNSDATPPEMIIKKISSPTPPDIRPPSLDPIIFDGLTYYEVQSATGRIWLDRNLGATQVATAYNDVDSYGDLYQWGRGADGHQLRSSSTISTLATTSVPNAGNSWDGQFILSSASPYDWLATPDNNLWQGVSGVNLHAPAGFRLPTESEWQAEIATWSSNDRDGAFNSLLKLPSGGNRNMIGGSLSNVGNNGEYWSSRALGTASRHMLFNSSSAGMGSTFRGVGNSVRLIKE